MDEERFLDFVWDVYYYAIDERYTELNNILYLFNDECHAKDTKLLLFLAKHHDFEYLFEYMDTLRRGIKIDLREIVDKMIEALRDEDLEYANYCLKFLSNIAPGSHKEIDLPFLKYAYKYTRYKLNNVLYDGVDEDINLEDKLMDDLHAPEVIKDILSPTKLDAAKKEFLMHNYNNIDTYTCTDRKGQCHTYTKINKEIIDVDIEEVKVRVDREVYLGHLDKAKEILKNALIHTSGFNPDLVRLYNHLYKDVRTNRLEHRICEEEVKDESYNILYNYDYNIDNITELINKALKGKEIDVKSYTDEEKGLIYGIISREAYKAYNNRIGDKYFRLATNYYKKNPEVNYFLKYIDDNRNNLGYQVVRNLTDAVRLELKK